MTFELQLSGSSPDAEGARQRTVDLARRLRSTVQQYAEEQPELSAADVDEALQVVRDDLEAQRAAHAARPAEGAPERARRVELVTVVLVIVAVAVMAAALFLVRRP